MKSNGKKHVFAIFRKKKMRKQKKQKLKKHAEVPKKMITEIIIFKVFFLNYWPEEALEKQKKRFDAENWTTLNFLFF